MKKGKHMWNGRIRALKKICSYHKTNKDHLFKKKKKNTENHQTFLTQEIKQRFVIISWSFIQKKMADLFNNSRISDILPCPVSYGIVLTSCNLKTWYLETSHWKEQIEFGVTQRALFAEFL